jgi:hypothetical protein
MPEQFLHGLRGLPQFEKMCREGVPQIVNANMGQSHSLQHSVEVVDKGPRVKRLAILLTKHQSLILIRLTEKEFFFGLASSVQFKSRQARLREWNALRIGITNDILALAPWEHNPENTFVASQRHPPAAATRSRRWRLP